MKVESTLAYYDIATITAIKSYIVEALGVATKPKKSTNQSN